MGKAISNLDKALKQNITPADIGAAASSHGTHVTYSTTAPKVAGTAAVGSANNVARGDHVHPVQTSVSGNAGTATKLATARTLTVGNTGKIFDGSANVSWSLSEIGAAASSHTHTTINGVYTSNGGAQPPSYVGNGTVRFNMMNKFKGLNGLPTYADCILMDTYTGSDVPWVTGFGILKQSGDPRAFIAVGAKGNTTTWAKETELLTVANYKTHVTPSNIGAAASSHGTHVTYASAAPKVAGTAAVGSSSKVAREDHVHPLQTTVSGNAGSATKLATARNITIGNKTNSFNGTANISYTLADIGAKAAEPTTFGLQTDYVAVRTAGRTAAQYYEFWDSGDAGWAGIKAGAIYDNNNRVYSAGNKPSLSDLGAAAASHGTHVTYASATPKANGTAAVGSSSKVAREDHVHPLQTSVSGNAGTATKLATTRTLTIGNTGKTFNGSANVSWSLSEIGAAAASHTHSNIIYQDTRDVNTTPDGAPTGLSVHLKSNGKDGLSDGGTYHSSLFIKGWNDYSGGPYGNLAITANNNLWFRASSSGTAWNSWKKVSLDGHTHSNYATTTTTGSLSSLKTSAKGSLVAAINEVFQSGSDAKTKLVNALTAKGISASTSDSWDTLIGKLSNIAAAQGANNIYAATSLPATGNTNDICIVSSPLPNHIHIGRIKPTSVDANDIWLDTDGTNLNRPYRVVTVGKLSTNLRVSSAYRLTSSGGYAAQVVAYYWDGSKWVVCCPVITTLKSTNSNSTGSISLGSGSRYDITQSGTCSVTMKVMEGIQYTGKCTVRVYHRYNYGNGGNTLTYTLTAYNKNGSVVTNVAKRTTLGNEDYTYFHDVNVPDPGGYIQVSATTAGSRPANDEYNLYMSVGGNKA